MDSYGGRIQLFSYPLAPPSAKVISHLKPSQRKSWGVHGIEGWYIGPAREHYKCYRIYNPKKRAEYVSDTVRFITEDNSIQFPTQQQLITSTASDLSTALSEIPSNNKNSTISVLKKLADIFQVSIEDVVNDSSSRDAVTPSNTATTGNTTPVLDTPTEPRVQETTTNPPITPRVDTTAP